MVWDGASRNGDRHDEQVFLPGPAIRTLVGKLDSFQESKFMPSLAETIRENGYDWCQTCRVFSLHAGVLASAYAAAGVHGVTAYWDQVYAQPRRRVDPIEQHVHSLLEVSPVMAAVLLTALHWDQAGALAGQGRPDFGLRVKRRDPVSKSARVRLLAAVTVFGILPYAEELWRCWRTSPTLAPLPEPAVPATQTLRIPAGGGGPPAEAGDDTPSSDPS